MGIFRQQIEVAAEAAGPFVVVEPVVDTGAFYSWLPRPVLQQLGVQATDRQRFTLADGSEIERETGEAVFRINGHTRHSVCIFGDEGTEPLLGAFTLEAFALAADPLNQRLVPMPRLYLLAGAAEDFATKHCQPCEGGTKPMAPTAAESYLALVPGWRLVAGEPLKIARDLRFKDFAENMAFVNRVAELAESQGHHPDFCVSWSRLKLELTTHAIGGLSENDFIMAAKINELVENDA
ncbi:MAG: 4a-hydroxytetrahydrobiopterin dehydratase [Dehalococcoidia bacterium]|nr:4a-hydroxytetrahydrobiopterin dehydratase [Dehalococcoidia bacterium]